MAWQLQEAKQKFSKLVRDAVTEGPQIVTRHGQEAVVVLSAREYRRLTGRKPDLKKALLAGPFLDDLAIERPREMPREIDLSDPRP